MAAYKRYWLIIIVCALTACAALVPKERLIPKERFVETLQKHFPLHREKGTGLFSVTIGVPQLSLSSANNRVIFDSDFVASAATLGLEGHFAFSSALRYDPDERAVFLREARIDSLQFNNKKPFPPILRSLIDRMVTDSIVKHPVYRLRPSELVVLGVEIDVAQIEVVEDGILLKLRTVPK